MSSRNMRLLPWAALCSDSELDLFKLCLKYDIILNNLCFKQWLSSVTGTARSWLSSVCNNTKFFLNFQVNQLNSVNDTSQCWLYGGNDIADSSLDYVDDTANCQRRRQIRKNISSTKLLSFWTYQ
jgi:hypothetical protein